jgi:hypothetical protein
MALVEITKRGLEAAAEYRAECLAQGRTPYRGAPIATDSDVSRFAAQAAEDYRKASEFHARYNNFAMAAWYTHMYRIYTPFPPDSGEIDILDPELDWCPALKAE